MSDFVFSPPPVASVAVYGETARFPVRRIFCVGRNYADHAREMGADPTREPPFFFTKPADAVVDSGVAIAYPALTQKLEYEMELVIAIGRAGANVSANQAQSLIWGYGAGVDLTRRDVQAVAKEKRHPWDMSKGFDHSAPCAPLRRAAQTGPMDKGRIWLSVNGVLKQESDLAEMIWPCADIIAALSRAVALQPGDLIYTGTPAGVGPIVRGDQLRGGIAGLSDIAFSIV